MALDFNETPGQSGGGETCPPGTYKVRIKLRAGGAGEDGLLKLSKNTPSEMLDLQFDVISGSYAGKRFFENWVVSSQSEEPTEGVKTAIGISNARIRATLESAHGFEHDDKSEAAKKARSIESYADLNGLEIVVRLGIRKQEGYAEKSVIQEIITPEDLRWAGFMKNHPRISGKGAIKPKPLQDDLNDEIPF